jgi:phosphatidylinositol alpha-1,6-mannosyltransferase
MINNEYPPMGGGSATVNQNLLQCWANKDEFFVDLITSETSDKISAINCSNINIIQLRYTRTKNIHHSTVIDLLKFLILSLFTGVKKSLTKKYDCYFGWSTLPSGLVCFLLGKIFRKKIIIRVSGPDIPNFETRYKFIYPIISPILKFIWNNSDLIITKCNFESMNVRKLANKAHIYCIPNGTYSKILNKPHISSTLRLICVSRLIERKRIDKLIDLVKFLTDNEIDVTLSIIGTGDLENELRNKSVNLNLNHKITFHGYVPRELLVKYYENADVFILLSENEGMSVACLEALGFGMPIITSNCGGAEDIVENGFNGYIIDENNLIKAAEIITNLYKNSSILSELSKNATEKSKSLDWNKIAISYNEAITKVGKNTTHLQ